MQILKKSALVAAITLLSLTLSTFVLALGVWQVFGTATPLKQALDKSGIYSNVIGGALDQSKQDQGQEGLNLQDQQLKAIIVKSFPPESLKQQTDGVLDGIYGWLQGTAPKLSFSFGLIQYKTQLANGLADYAKTKYATLPPCTAENLPTGDIDPINATCKPPGVDINAEIEKMRQQISSGEFLGKNGQVSADTIKNSKGQTLSEQLKVAPEVYQKTKLGIIICGILSLLLSAAVVLLSTKWRKGLHRVSVMFISVGGLVAALGWLSSAVLRRASNVVVKSDANNQLQHSGLTLVQILVDALRNWWVGAGLVLIVAGVITLLVLHFTKPKDQIKEEKAEKEFNNNLNDDKPEDWAKKLGESPKISKANGKSKPGAKAAQK